MSKLSRLLKSPPKALRKLVWGALSDEPLLPGSMVHVELSQPYLDDVPDSGDVRVDANFAAKQSERGVEYILDIRGPCMIEPGAGYTIRKPWNLQRHSLNPKCQAWKWRRPRVGWVASGWWASRRVHHPAVISLRDFNENNYWHFFNDVLSKLFLLDERGEYADLPLVVSGRLARMPYFVHMRETCRLLQGRELIVQDRQPVHAGRVIVVQTQECHPRNARFIRGEYAASQGNTPESGERKLFITRAASGDRSPQNLDAIHRLVESRGYEVIDPGRLPFPEQIRLFGSARIVVGLHGAGLTNIMFRRGPMTLVELHSPAWTGREYFRTARRCGFAYKGLMGVAAETGRGYRFDESALAALLDQLPT